MGAPRGKAAPLPMTRFRSLGHNEVTGSVGSGRCYNGKALVDADRVLCMAYGTLAEGRRRDDRGSSRNDKSNNASQLQV